MLKFLANPRILMRLSSLAATAPRRRRFGELYLPELTKNHATRSVTAATPRLSGAAAASYIKIFMVYTPDNIRGEHRCIPANRPTNTAGFYLIKKRKRCVTAPHMWLPARPDVTVQLLRHDRHRIAS